MDTNRLKKFAQKTRLQLMEGVRQRFLYWGFDTDGSVIEPVEKTSGGYVFRGQVYNDGTVYAKWQNLVRAVERHSVDDIIEEAAYTWFNRLLAIRILEKNGYTQPVLEYVSDDLHEPVILRNAKKGILPTSIPEEKEALQRNISDTDENELFASLLVYHCRNDRLLNKVFGHIGDYTELLVPTTLLNDDNIIHSLNNESKIADNEYVEAEFIGWLYQFYISEKKDAVFADFKKRKKARAEDIPAATQIFTPKWIVKYLIENTLGRVWLDFKKDSPIIEDMKYLVEPNDIGQEDPIIKDITDVKVLDPSVGSGHFLVVAFDLLLKMYKEEGYSERNAVISILRNNLYGLDICPRAVGLANFAIILKAAKYYQEILRGDLLPSVYAMPEQADFSLDEMEHYLGPNGREFLEEVHRAFKQLKHGRNIGSAISIDLSVEAKSHLKSLLESHSSHIGEPRLGILSQYGRIANALSDLYAVVVTNPPYMGSKNMNADLADYVKTHYPKSKSDLFSVFMEACTNRNENNGFVGMINQHAWMFLTSYRPIREHIINNYRINDMLHLGARLFDELSGEVVQTTAFTLKNKPDLDYRATYYRLIEFKGSRSKKEAFKTGGNKYNSRSQRDFKKISGSPVAYWVSSHTIDLFARGECINDHYTFKVGLQTGNNDLFRRYWHEVQYEDIGAIETVKKKWVPYYSGGGFRKWYGNLSYVIDWEEGGKKIINYRDDEGQLLSRPQNMEYYFKEHVSWSDIGSKDLGARFNPAGSIFDVVSMSVFHPSTSKLKYISAYLSSCVSNYYNRILAPGMHYSIGYIGKLPFLGFDQEEEIIETCNTLIEISKNDWNDHETSLHFSSHPLLREECLKSSLQESYDTLVAQWHLTLNQVVDLEERINQLFISSYSVEEELQPSVDLQNVTLLSNPLYKYNKNKPSVTLDNLQRSDTVKEFISYIVGCIFGRFNLNISGLQITHNKPIEQDLETYDVNGYKFKIDSDGIVPLMGSSGPFSDDIVERVQKSIMMIWGERSYTLNLNYVNDSIGESLEKYLTTKFWGEHKKRYKNTPIYWQFSSTNGAFKVLVYMHRMNRFTVQKIRQNYLFKHISHLEGEITSLSQNESILTARETKKLDMLRSNLIECREYDIRLKDVADRQIEIDLDDGVTENYKLFEGVVTPI